MICAALTALAFAGTAPPPLSQKDAGWQVFRSWRQETFELKGVSRESDECVELSPKGPTHWGWRGELVQSSPDDGERFVAGNMATNVTAGNPVANPNFPLNTVTAQVLWGAGADVGVYRVYPTADDNFWIDRQVNVVKITFTAAEGAGTNQLVYENHPDTAPTPDLADPLRRVIASSQSFTAPPPGTPPELIPAMKAKLKVAAIEGPTVNGAMRGVKFVEIGFAQSSTVTKQHAEFKTAPDVIRRYRYVLEGRTYRDGRTKDSVWYDADVSAQRVGVYSSASDPAATISNIDLFIDDTPVQPVTDRVRIPYGGFEYLVTWYRLVNDFQLFFSARTKETSLGSDTIYTQRGKANWYFNGSGEITWTAVPGGAVHTWNKGADSKNDGDKFFSEVSDGSVVPVTTGDIATDADRAALTSTTTPPWSVR